MAQTTPHPAIPMLAAAWAELIASAERPALFSSRDGRLLRLPPANERLSQVQLQQHLHQLLQDHDSSSGGADSMLAAVFAEHLPAPVKRGRPCSGVCPHVARGGPDCRTSRLVVSSGSFGVGGDQLRCYQLEASVCWHTYMSAGSCLPACLVTAMLTRALHPRPPSFNPPLPMAARPFHPTRWPETHTCPSSNPLPPTWWQ